MNMRFAKL